MKNKRPDRKDFDTDEGYLVAMDIWWEEREKELKEKSKGGLSEDNWDSLIFFGFIAIIMVVLLIFG